MVLPGHIAGGYLATYALLAVAHSVAPASLATFSQNEILAFYIIGMIAGELPDIDLFWFYLENRRSLSFPRRRESSVEPQSNVSGITLDSRSPEVATPVDGLRGNDKRNHREHITHLPLFWLCVSVVICLIGLVFNSAFIYFASFVILAGILSHFIFDSIEHGICWLWPFSKKRYCLLSMSGLPIRSSNEAKESIDEVPRGSTSRDQIGGLTYYWKYILSTYIKSPTFIAEVVVTAVALIVMFYL
jgi:hypothetical protein